MDTPKGGVMRNRIRLRADELIEGNLTSQRKAKELMRIIPDTH